MDASSNEVSMCKCHLNLDASKAQTRNLSCSWSRFCVSLLPMLLCNRPKVLAILNVMRQCLCRNLLDTSK